MLLTLNMTSENALQLVRLTEDCASQAKLYWFDHLARWIKVFVGLIFVVFDPTANNSISC